jgi:thiol-disulfide isomerase/thioredoxin
MAPAGALAQTNSAKDLLAIAPSLKKGVDYEVPTDPAAVAACKVEFVLNAQKQKIGYALRDGQGKLLRKFVDNDLNGKLDQWSFYQDGFEVYRESDRTNDVSPDECRWLNAAGTRVGQISGGKITGWKRLSAEESSKVLVQALVLGDVDLLETVLATPDELRKLGVPKGEVDQVAAAAAGRFDQVKALQKGLTGWNSQFVWNRLDGLMPHLIPADADTGLSQDLVLYENAVVFAGPASGQIDPTKVAFLQVPEMIRLGEVWKFVELPRAVAPDKAMVAASDGGIRSWIFRSTVGGQSAATNPEIDAALKELAKYDEENGRVLSDVDKKALAQYHVGRVRLLSAAVRACKGPEESLPYRKQIVDSLVAAVQTGLYADGNKFIEGVVAEDRGGKLESYAAFRKLHSDFAVRNEEPGTNPLANQKKWMGDLKKFLDKYPRSDEAPDALLQLASAYEFNAEEDEARKEYTQLAQEFPATDAGKKAAGALRRLDLVGKSFALKGTGLKNEEIDAGRSHGKLLLVLFWATWIPEPLKRDLPELVKVYQKYHTGGFEVIGVSLDTERSELDAYLKDNALPWPEIFEPGGMDSRLATEFGIVSLPTMILVDAQGKVVSRSIRTAAELDRQLEKLAAGNPSGVALGVK